MSVFWAGFDDWLFVCFGFGVCAGVSLLAFYCCSLFTGFAFWFLLCCLDRMFVLVVFDVFPLVGVLVCIDWWNLVICGGLVVCLVGAFVGFCLLIVG